MKTKPCIICLQEKDLPEYERYSRKCSTCFHLTRCFVCGEIVSTSDVRKSSPGKCKKCDNKFRGDKRKAKMTEAFQLKLKRHTTTQKLKRVIKPRVRRTKEESQSLLKMRRSVHRIFKKWSIDKLQKSFEYLAFSKEEFVIKFPEIPKGKDIDHKIPLSWFKRESPISIIFHLSNLQLLDNQLNKSKNNHWSHSVDRDFYDIVLPYIRDEYIEKISFTETSQK